MTLPGFLVRLSLAMLPLLWGVSASGWTHVAKSGETLDQLATRYYGDDAFSMVIRAANGFMHPDDGRLLQGERVEIPEVKYHVAQTGENWQNLAERHLGTSDRGGFLAELNGAKKEEDLVAGRVVKIPYQLLYVLAPDESIRTVVKAFLKNKRDAKWLQAYNFRKKKKWKRGDALLIPLMDVELTERQKEIVDGLRGGDRGGTATDEDRKFQEEAVKLISAMREDFSNGRYLEIVAAAQRLLGTGKLTDPQKIGTYQYLGFAYVAFGMRVEAISAFRKALEFQPEMELSPITTSPKILEVFAAAREGVPAGSKKDD